jgi:myo-inositol-1(or 4)-monophosphatase
MARSAILNVMVAAATKAARGLARDFNEVENLQVSRKGPADFVSAADRRAEEVIRAELERARPGYSFLMEESGASEGSDPQHRWIVDPLDGTTNFLHGIPQFAISIALERQGRLSAALVYDPISDELFTAERGSGAFLNDRRLRVSSREHLADSVVATGMPFKGHGDSGRYLKELANLMPAVAGVRRFGAAALDLAWVAAGRFDGFWERGLSPWDMAAGILLIREAGGFITDASGRDTMLSSGEVVAGNDAIHRQLLSLIRG